MFVTLTRILKAEVKIASLNVDKKSSNKLKEKITNYKIILLERKYIYK